MKEKNINQKKEFLKKGYFSNKSIQNKIEKIEKLQSMSTCINSYIGNNYKSKEYKDKISNIVSEIIDLKEELYEDIDSLIKTENLIKQKIDEVEDNQCKLLLTLRYLNYKSWREIKKEMNYSEPHMFRLHDKAFNLIKN
ncbi:MAG: DUF1492 domain-containing protein [Oscillospiraceae bacterium]